MYSVDECNNHKADPGSLPDKPHQARRSNHSVSTNTIPNQVISTAVVQWQFRPPLALRTDLSHIMMELWEIPVLRMAQ